MWQSTPLRFPADHPVAAGHFPGNPIIPGALLLDHIVHAIANGTAISLRAAKFLAPVRPGATLDLRWRTIEGGAITFECRLADDSLAMSGTFEIDQVPA